MLLQIIRGVISGQGFNIVSVIMGILAVLFIMFFILPFHEFAHGWVAMKLGDNTAKYNGRLTFNPLASVDIMGALFLLLFGYGWAKPVPVNSSNFKNPKRDMAITAAAGPISNLIAALAGVLVINIYITIAKSTPPSWLSVFLSYYVSINISLAAFNILPIPPLDGSRIVAAFLSPKALYNYYRYQNQIVLIMFFVLMMGFLDLPLNLIRTGFSNAVYFLGSLPFRLFH